MVSLFIHKADAVIIGADKILRNGNVINKVGSLATAILCKYYKKPFYVIATRNKFTNEKRLKSGEKDYKEIWNFTHPKLKITNIYFEEIDRRLIIKIITESPIPP
jgi:translation initiation factor 2B subunit (eIF-2B alpha/beta/delta family)